MLIELLLRHLARAGELRAGELAWRLGVALAVIEPTLNFLRGEKVVEVPRRGSFDADVAYALTDLGRLRAREAFEKCRYVGPAPVSLADYVRQVDRQSVKGLRIDRDKIRAALGDAVVSENLMSRLGSALNSGRSILMYGASGTGKTYLAERMVRTASGAIFVPHAVHVDGEIVQVFDPLVHQPIEEAGSASKLDRQAVGDRRWMKTRRPVVVTGGELTVDMLDLQFESHSRFYIAPPQMKANNGMMILDDLGRQRIPVRELLNRWIVPLDRNVDYMALHTGTKFRVPFDVTVVFSSNLAPSDIGDPAFLRRLGYKIHVGALDEAGYREVFRQACARAGLVYDEFAADFLIRVMHAENRLPLYATIPYDVLSKLRDRATFLGEQPRLDPDSLRWAWDLYFAPDEDLGGARSLDDLR
ncbi:ATP-binding protein [Burkholderiaceae bacterium FT117]|uniref:ATP-binding protein n=1 Tax=Zeimonas sediminis TaxID=2944268 RepID=UPI002342DC9A|nr:ATP-binding protein [Zeimonas sediminis]MCM5572087.1 ATP-binding protein [Zeimonas sediminis]